MFRMLTALALRRPVMVIVFWVAVVAVGFGVGGGVFMKLTAQVATVPGSETERALKVRADAAGPRPDQLTVVAHRRRRPDRGARRGARRSPG